MAAAKDITGQQFGLLTALRRIDAYEWAFLCACGNETVAIKSNVTKGGTKSCGCAKREIDIAGQKFGRLLAIKRVGTDSRRQPIWLFQCDCGNTKITDKHRVKNGGARSCGCKGIESSRLRRTHGLARTPEWYSWTNMLARCRNQHSPYWDRYGGRGISVCDRWKKFENFLADMGKKPTGGTIDRIDNNGNYEPGNCRWASRREQSNNRNNTIYVTYEGQTKGLLEWGRIYGLTRASISKRYRKGERPPRLFRPPEPAH